MDSETLLMMQKCYQNYAKTTIFLDDKEEAFTNWSKLYFKTHVRPHLPISTSAKILEIGCGYGRYLHAMQTMGYTNIFGVDISEDQIQYAKNLNLKNYVRKVDGLTFLERKYDCYDAILLLDVMEHLPSTYTINLIESIFRSLKTGGKLIIQVPNGLAPLSPLRYADFTHLNAFTPSSMSQVLRLGGFKTISHYPISATVHGIKSFIRSALWKSLFNPLIYLYMLIACGDRMGGIYTPNMLTVATKNKLPFQC